jgi:hypothetical protein
MRDQEQLQKAEFHFEVAEHLFKVTFPLAKDPKLLLGVIDNLAKSGEYVINCVLTKKTDSFPPDFISKLVMFRRFVPKAQAELFSKLHDLNNLHRTCPVEFRRGNTLVMCTNGYEMHTLSVPEIKQYLAIVKEIIESNKKP